MISVNLSNRIPALFFIGFVLLFFPVKEVGAQAFVTTWQTDNPGTSNNDQITIPTTGGGYNYNVDWGDGMNDAGVTGSITHTYAVPGTYTVSITGSFPRIFFNNGGDREKILTVQQWGSISWTSMQNSFYGCSNLTIPATDAPDLSSVVSLIQMFREATSFNESIDHWDVRNITTFFGMFWGASSFNRPLNSWNIDAATDISLMFNGASSFNQPLSNWNTTGVTIMEAMFRDASSFNQPVNNFDVSLVQEFNGVFERATSFNQPLDNWNTSSATRLEVMFNGATSFNQPIGTWDVSDVQNTSFMFLGATSFDQDLGNWNIESLTAAADMLSNAGLSTSNYDKTLRGWSTLDAGEAQIPMNVSFRSIGRTFCNAAAERQDLIDNFGWIITNDNLDCTTASFVTTWQTDNPGNSANDQISITTYPAAFGYDYDLVWTEVGNPANTGSFSNVTGDLTITFPGPGTYRVEITGTFFGLNLSEFSTLPLTDPLKILTIEQWGSIDWQSMSSSYAGCENLQVNATDAPDLSNVTSLSTTFFRCTSLNADFSSWDVSSITNMNSTFEQASSYNQPLNAWNVANVTTMDGTFEGASSFNQPLNNWDVSGVLDMNNLFQSASSYNQEMGSWNVSNVIGMVNMLSFTALSIDNYDQTLIGWDALPSVQTGVDFDALNVFYCNGETARTSLLSKG